MSIKIAQLSKVLYKFARAGVVVFSMFMVSPVNAASIEVGMAAAKAGDFKTALQEWRPLADQGHKAAQFNLGMTYEYGLGVTQSDKQAVKWFTLAADQGFSEAQNHLGFMYQIGKGVTKDFKQAVKWYRLAAEQGEVTAQDSLNELLEGKIFDWDLEDKVAVTVIFDLDESIKKYVKASVAFSSSGDRKLYFTVDYDNLKCEITKDSKKPTTSIWYFNSQAIKMLPWCKKHSDSGVYTLSLTPKSNKGRNFVVSAFRKAPSAVSIKIDTLDFKMSAKGFTKVWNSVSAEAL